MAPRAHVLPALPPLQGLEGFFEFAQLWTGWKFGQGKPEADCVHEVMRLSAADALGVVAAPSPSFPNCRALPEAVAFLRATRERAFDATAVACGAPLGGPLRLYRGLRHVSADALRVQLAAHGSARVPSMTLLSYALSEGWARSFARMRKPVSGTQLPGLIYSLEVGRDDFVFVESPELCDQQAEEEVLVLHRANATLLPTNVVDDSVPVARF